MDIGGMDMGGGDPGSPTDFLPTNKHIARIYWYLIVALVAAAGLRRLSTALHTLYIRRSRIRCPAHASRPVGTLTQLIATSTAIAREISYPQPWYASGRIARHFNPPPLGDCLVVIIYWAVILAMLWSGVILSPSSSIYAYKWEIVAFRAAWVSVSQIPLSYLLSCKISPVTLITGMSAERLNVFHRWAARTVFLTVTVHWSFFFTEWSLADIVQMELEMMTMVKYGFGAWAVMAWMLLSGTGIFRQQAYEIFVLQHIAAAAVLLWLLWVHVPAYATCNVWMSIGFLAFDWGMRTVMIIWNNVGKSFRSRSTPNEPLVGYSAHATALENGYTLLSVKGIRLSWTPGQFVYLQFPRLGLGQNHPFTIMSSPSPGRSPNTADFFIKAHSGLTKKLYDRATTSQRLQVLVSGTWGTPPSLASYDTLIFIATSTGISFTLPQFRAACSDDRSAVRAVHFHWIVRDQSHINHFEESFRECLMEATTRDLHVSITIHCTQPAQFHERLGSNGSSGISISDVVDDSKLFQLPSVHRGAAEEKIESGNDVQAAFRFSPGRPSLDSILRRPIEQACGETAIVGCGGPAISAQLRNHIASLSDERAVHKGSGALGIYLHIEHYGI